MQELPEDLSDASVLVKMIRVERMRRFGDGYLGLELWKRLRLQEIFAQYLDQESADVPWYSVAAVFDQPVVCSR